MIRRDETGPAESSTDAADRIRDMVRQAAQLLPTQGPIEVFVFRNPLEVHEHLPFDNAVKLAREQLGGHPYWPESRYRELLSEGRITVADLQAVLQEECPAQSEQPTEPVYSRRRIREVMLTHPLSIGPDAALRWVVAETDALERFCPTTPLAVRERLLSSTSHWIAGNAKQIRESEQPFWASVRSILDRAGAPPARLRDEQWEVVVLQILWQICRRAAIQTTPAAPQSAGCPLPRDLLLQATGRDLNQLTHDLLIRFCGAFLDQGYAGWNLPGRDQGFFRCFLSLYSQSQSVPDAWLRELSRELRALLLSGDSAEQSIQHSLQVLSIAEEDQQQFLCRTLLSLSGWAGMLWQMETAAAWTVRPAPAGTLTEFLAVQLILERHAIRHLGNEHCKLHGSLQQILEALRTMTLRESASVDDRRAFRIFQTAQWLGWLPEDLHAMPPQKLHDIIAEIDSFGATERRRLFHEAYERNYREATLNALVVHTQRRKCSHPETAPRPAFQLLTCIDDREESFRRHVEEIAPQCETFGAAGFFAVAMNYRGAADSFYKPLCPAVVTPVHYVNEDVGYTFEGVHHSRARLRSRLGRVTYGFHTRSRTFLGGIAAGIVGSLATAPLVARVLFPHLTARIRSRFGTLLETPPITRLQLDRYQPDPGPGEGHIGYSINEMADIVRRLLNDIGIRSPQQFSRLFVVCGHGSSSLNNPHESSYCCGACAGKRGGPNARAFAQMANDFRVRTLLRERGLQIPEDTVFVGAYHDTCSDSVVYYDLNLLPSSHRADFEAARDAVQLACVRNAHERCRRFASAPLNISLDDALRHVESRSQDISQPRPEYDHATNALCFVGRRAWSRGMFLDRRAFLVSYDPESDDEQSNILLRILAPAVPVCAGISLAFFFSTIDNTRYGSGSKLPHNVASLLGVMEGTSSDLRTGAYQQVCELHEPMRLMFVIESRPEVMLSIMDRNQTISQLFRGNWLQLAVIDPETSEVQVFRKGRFQPFEPAATLLPQRKSSFDCYSGSREHLPFSSIDDAALSESLRQDRTDAPDTWKRTSPTTVASAANGAHRI